MENKNKKTKICPYCGEEILASAKKCRYCGEWLEDNNEKMMPCPVCGEMIDKNAQICPYCKEPVKQYLDYPKPIKPHYSNNVTSAEWSTHIDKKNATKKTEDNTNQKDSNTDKSRLTNNLSDPAPETFIGAIKRCYNKSIIFEGRATRKEFWYFILFSCICSLGMFCIILLLINHVKLITLCSLYMCYNIIVGIPALSVGTRRLHDVGKSGWLWLISLIPFIGSLALLYYFSKDSDFDNDYGTDPTNDAATEEQETKPSNRDNILAISIAIISFIFVAIFYNNTSNVISNFHQESNTGDVDNSVIAEEDSTSTSDETTENEYGNSKHIGSVCGIEYILKNNYGNDKNISYVIGKKNGKIVQKYILTEFILSIEDKIKIYNNHLYFVGSQDNCGVGWVSDYYVYYIDAEKKHLYKVIDGCGGVEFQGNTMKINHPSIINSDAEYICDYKYKDHWTTYPLE